MKWPLRKYRWLDGVDPGKSNGDSGDGFPTACTYVREGNGDVGDLISSELGAGVHVLAIDIDLPCHLIETSPGKHHLIVEKAMSWQQLSDILDALVRAGIVEYGFAAASQEREKTFLRIHPTTPLEVQR